MIISKYSSVQYSEVSNSQLAGVTLAYRSERKNGIVESAIHLGGADFVPENGTEREVFRVWKNTLKLHWDAKRVEKGLKVDNGGIATKLRATTPTYIVVRLNNGETIFRWDSSESIFARVGIMPTQKDLDELEREYKKKLHKAAMASMNALKANFKFEAADEVEVVAENTESK